MGEKIQVVLEYAYVFLIITAINPISPPRITNNPPSPPPMTPTIMRKIAQTMVVTLLAPMIAMMPQMIVTIPKKEKPNDINGPKYTKSYPMSDNNPEITNSIPPISAK